MAATPTRDIQTMSLASLRRTQVTIGCAYVDSKCIITQRCGSADLPRFLRDHAIRVVRGPDAVYIVDHHPWALAWHREKGAKDLPGYIGD
jgi:hypothetical protein